MCTSHAHRSHEYVPCTHMHIPCTHTHTHPMHACTSHTHTQQLTLHPHHHNVPPTHGGSCAHIPTPQIPTLEQWLQPALTTSFHGCPPQSLRDPHLLSPPFPMYSSVSGFVPEAPHPGPPPRHRGATLAVGTTSLPLWSPPSPHASGPPSSHGGSGGTLCQGQITTMVGGVGGVGRAREMCAPGCSQSAPLWGGGVAGLAAVSYLLTSHG